MVYWLQEKIKNASQYIRLSGTGSVYFNGSFISRYEVPAVGPDKSFDCPLGLDPSIRVTYHPQTKKQSKNGFYTKTTMHIFLQHITVFNTKTSPIEGVRILSHIQCRRTVSSGSSSAEPSSSVLEGARKPVAVGKGITVAWEGAEDGDMDGERVGRDGKVGWISELFTCIFPLIIPEFWYATTATNQSHHEHFHCFRHLVSATNIISAFKTSNADADAYTQHYTHYRIAIQHLFPYRPSKPNHHYAMHNGALLKYWGPLASFSEFPGERMNGMLQKINTNRKLRDLDLTMLRQMSRRARIDALLHDEDGSRDLADTLDPIHVSMDTPLPLKPTEVSEILLKAPALSPEEYNALLYYLHLTGRPYRAFHDFPHPPNANILPPQAQRPLQVHRDQECTFSCERSHKGNSAIQFYNPLTQTHDTGFIQTIWGLPLEGSMRNFMVVRPHRPLSALEEGQAPFSQYSGFMTRIVDALPSDDLVIIEPTHIITHVMTFRRPAGTYGIGKETMVVCWALNRRRR
ncbi:hypothetical protein FPV67DRAFT_1669907 [Lyophyllum atratum]|nr:hypothetical protein FPV67DRAFT_1669907 [Lyophyllum atratum]